MFTQKFGSYVSEGDTIKCTVGKMTATACVYRDERGEKPDQRDCGFWPSLDSKSAGYIGPRSKSTLARHMAKARRVMAAWQNDEWFYCGVAVTISFDGIELTGEFDNALWGVECNYPDSDNDYLRSVANDLLSEALELAASNVAKLCGLGV